MTTPLNSLPSVPIQLQRPPEALFMFQGGGFAPPSLETLSRSLGVSVGLPSGLFSRLGVPEVTRLRQRERNRKMFTIIEEQGVDLEAIAVEEGTCSSSSSSSSLDIADVEFDD